MCCTPGHPPTGRYPPPRAQPRARRRARGPRGGSPNACCCRSSVTPSFHWSSMRLDVAVRSRPVLHDVAARQVDEVSVPVMLAPPAHRIGTGFALLRLAAIVVAHLELRRFKRLRAAWPVFACCHVAWDTRGSWRGGPARDAHDETEAPSTGISEYVGIHRPAVIGIGPVVDRHVPGNLLSVPVDLDLTLVHDAIPLGILPEKDVEPECELPRHRGEVDREELQLVCRVFIHCVMVAWGIDAPTARPLPRGALRRGWHHPEGRAVRRHADFRLVGTRRGQQSGRNEARPDDQASVFSHHAFCPPRCCPFPPVLTTMRRTQSRCHQFGKENPLRCRDLQKMLHPRGDARAAISRPQLWRGHKLHRYNRG